MFDLTHHLQLQSLYVAPAALGDYCDSSGCLPGQIPLPGLKPKSVINKSAELTMNQVDFLLFMKSWSAILLSEHHYFLRITYKLNEMA
jgi:hypothetical protein